METIAYTVGAVTTEISFKDLGVGPNPRLDLATHDSSRFILPLPGIAPETAAVIPFEAQCVIYTGRSGAGGSWSGGSILFQGRRTDNNGDVSGDSVYSELTIEDAWYDLRLISMQALWTTITGGTVASPTYGSATWPDCVLFQFTPAGLLQPDGSYAAYSPLPVNNHITTGQAIREILAYAIFVAGVKLQIGTIDPSTYAPFYPIRSMRIADALKCCLRPHPDCGSEIDYTTTPPTFNIRKRSSLTPLTLPYKGTDGARTHLTSSVRPRPELIPSRVGIYIKQSSEISGQSVVDVGTDIYPAVASGLRSLDASLDILGPKTSVTKARVVAASFDPTNLAWWASKLPALRSVSNGGQVPDSGVGALALVDAGINGGGLKGIKVVDSTGSAINLANYQCELVNGSVADWMTLGGGGSVNVIDATVTAFFNYAKTSAVGAAATAVTDKFQEHSHSVRVKLTNSPNGTTTYTLTQLLATGEIYPAGLAQAIYNTLSTLQYNFTHTILETPFATVIKPGLHALNLSGGAAAWTSMAAQVQQASILFMFSPVAGIISAKTTIRCGPVAHLEPGELVQLLNLFTNRDFSKINPNERSSGVSIGGGQIQLPADNVKENSAPAQPIPVVTNCISLDGSNNINGQIQHDAAQIGAILAAITATPLET